LTNFRVAITGGIGSGKSTVCKAFKALGADFVDTDEVAHALTQPQGVAIAPIAAAFGDAFIDPNGAMDRAAMRAAVFAKPAQRLRLEAILHPLIRQETDIRVKQAFAQGSAYVLVAIPLLVESMNKQSAQAHQRILVVDCSTDEQRSRVMSRSKLTGEQVDAIMGAQASREQRLACANDVLYNRDFQPDLLTQIGVLHQLYRLLAQRLS
jgi:dephospho-CoA kinase